VPEKTTLCYSGPSWNDVLDASKKQHRSLELTSADGKILRMRVINASPFRSGKFTLEGITGEGEVVKFIGSSSKPNLTAEYEPVV